MSDGNTVVELCAGYGGLFMGLNAVTDARLTAYAEIDPGASAIMAHHHPDVPNLGDVKAIDWSSLDSPRWLIGGYPCQPFSDAGQKLGSADPRHLWPFFVPAIAALQPDFVLFENVRGHVRRGLTEVLHDLTELGYGGAWVLLKASDIGAPHQRARVFILGSRHVAPGFAQTPSGGLRVDAVGALLPTPEAKLAHSGPDYARFSRKGSGGPDLTTAVHLLTLPPLLPTPSTGVSPNGHGRRGGKLGNGRQSGASLDALGTSTEIWGKYAGAVARGERVFGRRAPSPTMRGPQGGTVLNPPFPEWMMGLPAGHVTGLGLGSTAELVAIGNGVVPLQASYAVSVLMRTLSQLPRKVRR